MSDLGDYLSGHLGDRAAALVDGQLGATQEERAWQHVHACPGCRQAVEQQATAKRTLGGLGDVPDAPAPASWLHPDAASAWEQVAEIERQARRRTTLLGVVGGGALTASLAVAVVVGGGLGAPAARPVPADISTGIYAPAGTARAVPAWTGTATGSESSRAFRTDRTD